MRILATVLMLAVIAFAGCAGTGGDVDDDALTRSEEESGWTVDVRYLDHSASYRVTSDPQVADTDGDGLLDGEEARNGLDPRNPDTDEDGLTDCQETTHFDKAVCEAREDFTCPDGAASCTTNTDPLIADSDPGGSRYVIDAFGWLPGPELTGDGIPDGMEVNGYEVTFPNGTTITVTSDPRNVDTDGDGLHDGEEALLFSSHPNVMDTDGDGCRDGLDPWPSHGAERYQYGLGNFTLQRDLDGDDHAEVAIDILLADGAIRLPSASGSFAITIGETQDLSAFEPEAVRPMACGTPPFRPWVTISALVVDKDGPNGDSGFLSIQEGAPAPLFWNVRTDRFAWNPDASAEETLAGPVVWTGPDAVFAMHPSLLLPSLPTQAS